VFVGAPPAGTRGPAAGRRFGAVGGQGHRSHHYVSHPGSRTASTARRWDAHLRDYRNSAFVNGFGGRSTQNLTYRALRRLNVSIPDMVDRLVDECIFVNESVG